MLEGKRQAVVYGRQFDDGILNHHPLRVLQKSRITRRNKHTKGVGILEKLRHILRVLTLLPTESIGQSYLSNQLSFPLSEDKDRNGNE